MSNIIKYSQVLEGESIYIGQEVQRDSWQDKVVECMQTQQEADEMIRLARQEAQAIIKDAQEEATRITQEAQMFCEQLKKQQDEISEQEKNMLKQQLEEAWDTIHSEKAQILESAHLEKNRLIESAEVQVVDLIKHLVEVIIGECVMQIDWINVAVRKLIYTEQLQLPLSVYISSAYSDNQVDELEESFKSSLGEVYIQTRGDLPNGQIEVETPLGNMEYDINRGLEHVLSQLITLNQLVEK